MFKTASLGRSAVVATTFALLLGTAACGNRTGEVDEAVPGAPAAFQQAPQVGSADALERRAYQQPPQVGSADALERRAYQDQVPSESKKKPHVGLPDKRVPDIGA